MSPEDFNVAYRGMVTQTQFIIPLDEDWRFSGSPHAGRKREYLMVDSFAGSVLNLEVEHGTLAYVFFINDTPVSYIGAFGVMTLPLDSFQHYPSDFLNYRGQILDVILDLTSPLVDGNGN